MSESLLVKSIEKVSDFSTSSHWIWHGGEPFLMGIDFFKLIKDIQKFYSKRGKIFSNSIQTNGSLIDEEFLGFIQKSNDFRIGTSLDGPKHIHDQTRIYKNGKGSFDKVMKGIKSIKTKISNLGGGAICVINSTNINHPKELYNFFSLNKINVKLNPLIKSGRAKENLVQLGINPKQYKNFLSSMLKIYEESSKKEGETIIDVEPFMGILGNILTEKALGCNYVSSCRDSFISIGPQGDLYPCGRFDGAKEFWMGNIRSTNIEEAMNSRIHKQLKKRNLESITECNKCNFGDICNSGCMHNAYCEGDILGKDPYCESYKPLFKKFQVMKDIELKGGEK